MANVKSAAPERLAIGGLVALAAAMGIGRFIYTPILPHMVAALGQTQSQAGLIAAANFAGYLAGALLASGAWLRGSARGWLLAALVASALTTMAMAVGNAMGAFLVFRFLGGLASAVAMVFASSMVLERLAAAGRGHLSSVHFAGVGVGIAASAVLVAGIELSGAGWRAMWLAGGLFSVVALAVVAACVAPAPPRARAGGAAKPGRPLGRLIVAYGLFGFGYVITATFIVQIVRGGTDLRAYEAWIWLLVGLSAVPSVALWMAAGRRVGVLRAFAIACVVEAVGAVASVVSGALPALLLAAAFLGATFMAITALGLVAARARSGGAERRAVGLMTAAFGLGQIVGPLAAGAGFDWTGSFFWSSILAAACLLVGAALTWTMDD